MSDKPLDCPVMVDDEGQIIATFPEFSGKTAAEIDAAIKEAVERGEKLPGHWDETHARQKRDNL